MKQGRQQYHHGALRDALLDSALLIIADGGLDALSLRGIARSAGVSQAAPYSHFRNRRELLAGVAQRGFLQLAGAMLKAESNEVLPADRVMALGICYVHFANSNPALYSLMFSDEFRDLSEFPELADSAAQSYTIIGAAVTELLGEGAAEAGTLAAWAMVHGVADLVQRGRMEMPATVAAQRAFIRRILAQLF